jgi:phage terminase large subunit-like protein
MRLLPGQRAFVNGLYGGRRRVRIGVKSEPRGNGKTGFLSGLALCHLLGPEAEPRGAVYSASIDRSMSALIFAEMTAIILAVPSFAMRVNIQRFHKKIEVLTGKGQGSEYEALSADARRGHGLAPSLWIYDELAQAKDGELLNNLMTAMGKRARSLGVVISTQADTDLHPLSQLIDDGLSGSDPTILVQLTVAPTDADPFDPETIRAVNPALGVFLNAADVFAEAERARRVPAFRAAFRNRRLNQRIQAEERWITLEAWDACAVEPGPLTGRRAFLGVDLSATADLTAVAIVAPTEDGGYDVRVEFFCPKATISARSLRDRVPYVAWAEQGYLVPTGGNSVDYDVVLQRIHELVRALDVVEVCVDPWNATTALQRLQGDGVPAFEVAQTMPKLSAATKELERLVLNGRLRHDGHPVLRWCVSNVALDVDSNGNIKPNKRRSRDKIDGVSALVTALAGALVQPTAASAYDTHRLLVV